MILPSAFPDHQVHTQPTSLPTRPADQPWPIGARPRGVVGALQRILATVIAAEEPPRIDTSAKALGMSVRTLQRRLAATGSSFKRLVRAARFERAACLLQASSTSVLHIALDLGYSDHAHFTRAFRRWSGVSPLAYRRAARIGRAADGVDVGPLEPSRHGDGARRTPTGPTDAR